MTTAVGAVPKPTKDGRSNRDGIGLGSGAGPTISFIGGIFDARMHKCNTGVMMVAARLTTYPATYDLAMFYRVAGIRPWTQHGSAFHFNIYQIRTST